MSTTAQYLPTRTGPRRIAAIALATVVAVLATVLWFGGTDHTEEGPTAVFVQENVSGEGYAGRFVLGNRSDSLIKDWRVEFDLPDGTSVTAHWDATMKIDGQHYVFTSDPANREILTSDSVSFGFTVSGTGAPANCTFQGIRCAAPPDRNAPSVPKNLRVTDRSVSTSRWPGTSPTTIRRWCPTASTTRSRRPACWRRPRWTARLSRGLPPARPTPLRLRQSMPRATNQRRASLLT